MGIREWNGGAAGSDAPIRRARRLLRHLFAAVAEGRSRADKRFGKSDRQPNSARPIAHVHPSRKGSGISLPVPGGGVRTQEQGPIHARVEIRFTAVHTYSTRHNINISGEPSAIRRRAGGLGNRLQRGSFASAGLRGALLRTALRRRYVSYAGKERRPLATRYRIPWRPFLRVEIVIAPGK